MNRYFKLSVLILTGALLFAVFMLFGSASAQKEHLPKLQIAEAEIDLGEFYEGEDIKHTFVVRNAGTAVLEIKVKPG